MLHDAARARCPRKAMTWRKRSATLGTAGWGKTVQEGKWSGKAQLTQASQLSRQATSQYLQQGSNSGAEPYSSWLGYWILYLQHTAIAKKSHPLPPENKLIPLSPPLWRKINGESVPEEKKKKKKKVIPGDCSCGLLLRWCAVHASSYEILGHLVIAVDKTLLVG